MPIYQCQTCGHIYDENNEAQKWNELADDWTCPICGVDKSFFEVQQEENKTEKPIVDEYLGKWSKTSDPNEGYLAEIHQMAKTGKSIIEPMRTKKPVFSWDDILIKGAQLAKIPLNEEVEVKTHTIIGKNAKHPLILETPILISHMSFGALSKEFKTALAKGSARAKTAICSGEGGILPEEFDAAYKYIFEYVPNEYSVTDEYLKSVDAIEIKIGQAAKPGMGGHLPGEKVTGDVAKTRNREAGKDIYSPAAFKDINNKEELKNKIEWLRQKSDGKPIGVKIAAGNIEKDLDRILYADPDFITIDGRGGATGSAPKYIKDSSSVPTLFALYRAQQFLLSKKKEDISIIITGGLRVSSDFAKAIAMGASAVAIATSAMIAGGCQQYRICHTGKCPVGIATQDPELRKRIDIEKSAQRIENFLKVSTNELKSFARMTGNQSVHYLAMDDLCTTNSEISNHTTIVHI